MQQVRMPKPLKARLTQRLGHSDDAVSDEEKVVRYQIKTDAEKVRKEQAEKRKRLAEKEEEKERKRRFLEE